MKSAGQKMCEAFVKEVIDCPQTTFVKPSNPENEVPGGFCVGIRNSATKQQIQAIIRDIFSYPFTINVLYNKEWKCRNDFVRDFELDNCDEDDGVYHDDGEA
jgi:hypothetical protein